MARGEYSGGRVRRVSRTYFLWPFVILTRSAQVIPFLPFVYFKAALSNRTRKGSTIAGSRRDAVTGALITSPTLLRPERSDGGPLFLQD